MQPFRRRAARALAAIVFALASAHSFAAAETPQHADAARPAVVAQAAATTAPNDAATDAAATPSTTANDTQSGIPWWVWLIIALLVIGLLFYFLNRKKKDPTISTRGGGPR